MIDSLLPSFVTTQLTPAWQMFGEDLVINFKPFGKANVYLYLEKQMYIYIWKSNCIFTFMDKLIYIYNQPRPWKSYCIFMEKLLYIYNQPSLIVFVFVLNFNSCYVVDGKR